MAPANLDTVSNDVLLVVVDWLEAIVAAGVAACYRKHRRIESTSSILRRTAHLRSSMMSLSSVNKHFRGLLAFQVLKQMTVTVPYSRWEMHGVIQILTSSLALQDNLQSLVFTPEAWTTNKYGGRKDTNGQYFGPFDAFDKLFAGFRSLRNLQKLHLEMPFGYITKFRSAMLAANPTLFPRVKTLTVSPSSSFVLKQCPSVEAIVLTHSHDLFYGHRKKTQSAPALNFAVHMRKLREIVKAMPHQGANIGTATLAFVTKEFDIYHDCEASMLIELANAVPSVKSLEIFGYLEMSREDLKRVMASFAVLEEVHCSFVNRICRGEYSDHKIVDLAGIKSEEDAAQAAQSLAEVFFEGGKLLSKVTIGDVKSEEKAAMVFSADRATIGKVVAVRKMDT